jgi:hypothetical protein
MPARRGKHRSPLGKLGGLVLLKVVATCYKALFVSWRSGGLDLAPYSPVPG